MKSLLSLAVVAVGLVLGSLTSTVEAHEHQHVRYTTYGQDYSRHFDDHSAAHAFSNHLNRLGVSAHVHHDEFCYEVHYSLGETRSATFECDFEAHRFAHWLGSLGFATQVVHH